MVEDSFWIVMQDESVDTPVLGVFRSEAEASAYSEAVSGLHSGKTYYARFEIGYRYHDESVLKNIRH